MRLLPSPGGPRRGQSWVILGLIAALTLALALPSSTVAQEIPPPSIGGFNPRLPLIPGVSETTPTTSIVEGIGSTTSTIELKVGQGRFLTLRENLVVPGQPAPFLAVGDPSVTDFYQVGPRQLRLLGKRLGTTDLSITTGSGKTYDFEVQVVADLETLRAQLRQAFPDATIRISQIREKVVIEGQARDVSQVSRIVSMITGYMKSSQSIQISGQVGDVRNVAQANAETPPSGPSNPPLPPLPETASTAATGVGAPATGVATTSPGAIVANQIATDQIQIVNLMRVPTSQQVMLKVRVAELNRTALRQIGADFLASIPQFGDLFGTQIGGSNFLGSGTSASTGVGIGSLGVTNQSTFYGTFAKGQFTTVLSALRRNNLLKILAEPNLMTMNGFQANFLAGGEFPVPVLSGSGSGGNSINVQFKEFGVRLAFLPIIQDDDVIRLTVDPEVSTIDFTVGTTLVPGGSSVPGLNTRKSHSTVELKSGDTLAIAGLMQLSLSGSTQRLPGLGDLPYIGEFFSNTTSNRIEKELLVTVTPYIVEPMKPGEVPAGPGDEVRDPNDLEFYFLNRIESRTSLDKRSTTTYDDPLHLIRHAIIEKKYLIGPSGYSK